MTGKFRFLVAVALASIVASACSTTVGVGWTATTDPTSDTIARPSGAAATGATRLGGQTTTTEAQEISFTPTPLIFDSPDFELVTITTSDGVALNAEYYKRGPTAVLFTHDIATRTTEEPIDRTFSQPWTSTLADAGYTVLAPDFRGHGQSEGEVIHVNDTKLDLAALYQFLADEGYQTIASFNMFGSAPVALNAQVTDDSIDFDAMALLFTPLARLGNDLVTDLPNVDVPTWIVQYDEGSTGGIPKRLAPHTPNLWDAFVFPKIPSNLHFIDIHGEELAGRMIAFLKHVEQQDHG